MSECQEIADSVPAYRLEGITCLDAAREIAKQMMPTEGPTLLDNVAWGILQRAKAAS